MATTKITVSLPDSTVDELKRLAEKEDRTVSAVLRQAIDTLSFINEETSSKRLLLEDTQSGERQEVIFR